jgi:4-hydroxyphenylpyruvate dioxygenase
MNPVPSPASVSLACSTVTFAGDFPAKIQAMSATGFRETEVWLRDLFEHPEGPEIAMKILADQGVAPIALQALRNFEGCPAAQRETRTRLATACLDLCAGLGIPLLVLASNCAGDADGNDGRIIDDLGTLGDLAEARGVRIAYEPIAWATHVHTLQRAVPLLAGLNHAHVGLQLDSFHICHEPGGTDRMAAIRGIPVFLAEVSDYPDLDIPIMETSRAYRLFPHEGNHGPDSYGSALACIGYQGPLVVEVFNAYYKSLDAGAVARRAYASLAEYCRRIPDLSVVSR